MGFFNLNFHFGYYSLPFGIYFTDLCFTVFFGIQHDLKLDCFRVFFRFFIGIKIEIKIGIEKQQIW
ncbi:hypothetical protein ABTO36_19145, partial [Acinetobacter baumannii]